MRTHKLVTLFVFLSLSGCLAPDLGLDYKGPKHRPDLLKAIENIRPQAHEKTHPPKTQPSRPKCLVQKHTVQRGTRSWSDSIALPTRGVFFQEGHLATKEDHFGKRNYPHSTVENIEAHMKRSARILGVDPSKIYNNKWAKLWTPPENGRAGQGSIGPIKPHAEEEMYIFNMMFKSGHRPPVGEKWLLSFRDKYIVVVGGYEVGPASSKRLGGAQPEVFYLLGAPMGKATFKIHGPLKDQNTRPGVIRCEDVDYISE